MNQRGERGEKFWNTEIWSKENAMGNASIYKRKSFSNGRKNGGN